MTFCADLKKVNGMCRRSAGIVLASLATLAIGGILSGCDNTSAPTTPTTPPVTIDRWDFPDKTGPNFGYGRMRSSDFAANFRQAKYWPDQRPVLLGAVQFTDMPLHRSITEVEQILFGDDSFSTHGFFGAVSLGNLQLVRGATLRTANAGFPRSQNTSDTERGLILQKALDSGMDLSALYDRNHDGVIDDSELVVVSIVADAPNTGGGGAVRPYCQTLRSSDGQRSARFCGRAASFSEYAGFHVITHELTHTMGSIDLYNIGELAVNLAATLMAGAGTSDKIYLDPYHRIKLGWIGPRVFDVASATTAGANRCFSLAPSHLGAASQTHGKPIIIYDSRRGLLDYYIVEYRRRAGYDLNVFDEGLAIWYVHEGTDQFAAPVTLGFTRPSTGTPTTLASLSNAGNPSGDDQLINAWADGHPLVITPGVNMVFDTVKRAPDVELKGNGVLLYPPEHFTANQTSLPYRDRQMGYPKFWHRAELESTPFTWYEPYSRAPASVGVSLRTADFPTSTDASIRLDLVVNSTGPMATDCQSPVCKMIGPVGRFTSCRAFLFW